jgi:hypothetical protein
MPFLDPGVKPRQSSFDISIQRVMHVDDKTKKKEKSNKQKCTKKQYPKMDSLKTKFS